MSELRNYILSKALESLLEFDAKEVLGKIHTGVIGIGTAGGWDRPKPKAPVRSKKPPKPLAGNVGKPKPENSSTDLRTQLAYVLADKLEEYRGERFGYEPGEAPARGKGALKTAVGDALSKMRYGTKKPAEVEGGVIKDPGTRGGISTPVRTNLGNLSKTGRWKKIEAIPGMPKLPPREDKEPKPKKPLTRKYVGPKKPPVTEWKARIAQILADKLEESFPNFDRAWQASKQKQKERDKQAKKTSGMRPPPEMIDMPPVTKPKPENLDKFSAPNPKLNNALSRIIQNEGREDSSTNLKDRMVEALTQKLTESPMEFTYGRETPKQKAENEARLEQLRAGKAKKPRRESNPEAGGGQGTKPGTYFTNRNDKRVEN